MSIKKDFVECLASDYGTHDPARVPSLMADLSRDCPAHDYLESMRAALADHIATMQTISEINIAIDAMPIMDRPVARAKLLAAIATDAIPIPERRKHDRIPGRHGMARLAVSPQHLEKLESTNH